MPTKKHDESFEPWSSQGPAVELLLMEMSLQFAVDLAEKRGLKRTELELQCALAALRSELAQREGHEIIETPSLARNAH